MTAIFEVLDAGLIAHVGVVTDSGPIVLPMAYGRTMTGCTCTARRPTPRCGPPSAVMSASRSRSSTGSSSDAAPFHNSMNYRGVVVRGTARLVDDRAEHLEALRLVSDHVVATWDTGRAADRAGDPQDDGDRRAAGRDVGEDPNGRSDRRTRGSRWTALGWSRPDPFVVGTAGGRAAICPTGSRSRRRSRRSTAVSCEPWSRSDPADSTRDQTRISSTARATSGTTISSPPTRVMAVPIERLPSPPDAEVEEETARLREHTGEKNGSVGPLRSLAEPGAVEV